MLLVRGLKGRIPLHNMLVYPEYSSGGSMRQRHPCSRNVATGFLHTTSTRLEGNIYGSYEIILPQEPFIHGIKHIPKAAVPLHIPRPSYVGKLEEDPLSVEGPYIGDGRIELGGEDDRKLRKAADLARLVLSNVKDWIKPGITTAQVDQNVFELITSHNAYPSPLDYCGFPKSCCTSVNNVIAHGIPDDRPLQEGDIVNVDVTVYLDEFHGDTSRTFLVGQVDQLGIALVNATEMALQAGIEACGPYKLFSDIGNNIYKFAKQAGFAVNDQFTGHGIGRLFHRPPWILHSKNEEPGHMLPGHVFTIEPALVQGDLARGWMFPDGWTVSTESGARSAQAEHMVLITDTGVEVLT